MRRRYGGLHGTPEVHERLIPDRARLATQLAEGAERNARLGRCEVALSLLTQASNIHGGMFEHIFSLVGRERQKHDTAYDRVGRAIGAAREAIEDCFHKHCRGR